MRTVYTRWSFVGTRYNDGFTSTSSTSMPKVLRICTVPYGCTTRSPPFTIVVATVTFSVLITRGVTENPSTTASVSGLPTVMNTKLVTPLATAMPLSPDNSRTTSPTTVDWSSTSADGDAVRRSTRVAPETSVKPYVSTASHDDVSCGNGANAGLSRDEFNVTSYKLTMYSLSCPTYLRR